MRAQVCFGDNYALSSGGTDLAIHTFRANNCRDPQLAVGGGSCSGFLELANFYTSYRVTDCRVEVHAVNTANLPTIAGIFFRPYGVAAVTTGTAAQQQLLEAPGRKSWKLMGPATTYEGRGEHLLTCSARIADLQGEPASDDDYSALFAGDPAIAPEVDVIGCVIDGTTTGVTVNTLIVITYTIDCHGARVVATD